MKLRDLLKNRVVVGSVLVLILSLFGPSWFMYVVSIPTAIILAITVLMLKRSYSIKTNSETDL